MQACTHPLLFCSQFLWCAACGMGESTGLQLVNSAMLILVLRWLCLRMRGPEGAQQLINRRSSLDKDAVLCVGSCLACLSFASLSRCPSWFARQLLACASTDDLPRTRSVRGSANGIWRPRLGSRLCLVSAKLGGCCAWTFRTPGLPEGWHCISIV